MNDIDFIREFARISVAECCRKNKVNMPNVYHRKVSKDKAKKVREEIEHRIAKLYIKGDNENVNETSSL